MSEQVNTPEVKGRFSMIDLLMVIMVVGVLMTVMIPIQQTKKHEMMVRDSLNEMKKIIIANETWKANDDFNEYAWYIGQLDLKLDTSVFEYSLTDTTIVAISHKNTLAKEEKTYYFDLRDKKFRITDDSEDVILRAWLP